MTLDIASSSPPSAQPRRADEEDGATVDIFTLPTDEESLAAILRDLFHNHWRDVTFGLIIQGAACELHPPSAPTYFRIVDGYLTVAFGISHFHICTGAHKHAPPALAAHRRTARAELYRRLSGSGAPISWGLRLFNGHDEQLITVLLPNPFIDPYTDKLRKTLDSAQLDLWDSLRARWLGAKGPDPIDRSGKRFQHD